MWIESHQGLLRHPKTLKAAATLGVSVPTVVGHLHALWWWAMDYAPDGDLSDFDAADLALAAMWEGDPADFTSALIGCGPGAAAGFLDQADDGWSLHDWSEYGGKLHAKRAEDAARKRKARAERAQARKSSASRPTDVQRPSTGRPTDVRRTSDGHGENPQETAETGPRPVDVRRTSDGRDADVRRTALVEDRTGQDRTGQDHAAEPDDVADGSDGPPVGGVTATVPIDGFDLPLPVATRGMPLTDAIVDWAQIVGLAEAEFRTPLQDARLAISTIAQTIGRKGQAMKAAIAVCGDYLLAVRGIDELDRRTWGMLQAQVPNRGPSAVLDALAEALDRGAGLDGGHEEKGTVAVVEYALAILRGDQAGAA